MNKWKILDRMIHIIFLKLYVYFNIHVGMWIKDQFVA